MLPPTWHQAPLFTSLQPAQRTRLEIMAGTRRLDSGEMLFLEDEPCTGFFVLVEGAIQLTRSGTIPGAHPTLAVILPINSFAEAAMFGGEAFPATATAIKPSKVVHFPKGPFLGALREDPDLALAVIHAQAVWLRKITQKVQELSGSDSLERLRTWLRANLPTQAAFALPVTKKALAAQLGMTPETLSRGLRVFQDQGLLEVQGTRLRKTGPI
ncbi:MAG: Crp/Fnr family transcriptional regulator [Holophaga sp.]|nr:Crp/Fnr family transcriptional regulator [Holophaga sp.]